MLAHVRLFRRAPRLCRWLGWAAAAAVACLRPGLPAIAAERQGPSPREQPGAVDLFTAMESGQVEARIIPRNSQQCQLLVRNKTDQPLSVALPVAFAAVPVLAQQQLPLPLPPSQQPQPLGVALNRAAPVLRWPQKNNGQWAPNIAGQRPLARLALWTIAPEKVGWLRLPSVCLALGRPDPQPRFPYEIRRLEELTTDPVVAGICAMLGSGELSQDAAQLAAWHLENGMSWNQLATFCRPSALAVAPRFTPGELAAAQRAVETIRQSLARAASNRANEFEQTNHSPR